MEYNTFIYKDLSFIDNIGIIRFLAEELQKNNIVKGGYVDTILKREESFPTGLPSKISVAIPHCDHVFVNSPAISVGILKEPVRFMSMESPNKILDVRLVIMLALDKPHGHIEMLNNIIELIRNTEDIEKILECSDDKIILNILKKYLWR